MDECIVSLTLEDIQHKIEHKQAQSDKLNS